MTTQTEADVRLLAKWLNEEQTAPIDKHALARVLATMQAQPEQCRKEQRGNGEYVCDCKSGECPVLAQPEQEPMAFLANGTRFKISYDSRQSGGQIHGIPPELGGRWVAFVAADDDCHLRFTTPPQRKPLADEQKDAARWRWLSWHIKVAWNEGKFTSLVRIVSDKDRESLNASIDRMMAGDWSDADAAHGIKEGA